jgi:hypothetical protein
MNTAIAFIIFGIGVLFVGAIIGFAVRDSFKGQNMSILRVDGVDEQPTPNKGLAIDPSKAPPPNLKCAVIIDTANALMERVPNCDATPSSMPDLMSKAIKTDWHPIKPLSEVIRRLASGEFDGRFKEMDEAIRERRPTSASDRG